MKRLSIKFACLISCTYSLLNTCKRIDRNSQTSCSCVWSLRTKHLLTLRSCLFRWLCAVRFIRCVSGKPSLRYLSATSDVDVSATAASGQRLRQQRVQYAAWSGLLASQPTPSLYSLLSRCLSYRIVTVWHQKPHAIRLSNDF